MIELSKYKDLDTVYIVVGSLNKAIFSQLPVPVYNKKGAVETHYVFTSKLENDLKELPENINVLQSVNKEFEDLKKLLYRLQKSNIQVVAETDNLNLQNKIKSFIQNNKEEIEYLQRMDFSVFSNMVYLNSFKLVNPIINHTELYTGQTAIVLGAAPSLEQHLSWIKQNQNKMVIYAVVRLAKRLFAEGIKVDFFIASDPTEATMHHAIGLEKFYATSVLITQHYASPSLLNKWLGKTIYFGAEFPDLAKNFVTEQNVELLGGTVANLALISALGMGCKKVYLTGMDMCFADVTKTHESSSLEAKQQQEFASPFEVETYQGTMAKTTVEFKKALDVLRSQIDDLTSYYGLENDFIVANLSITAGKVAGIDYLDYKTIQFEAEDKLPIQHILSNLLGSKQLSDSQEEKKLAVIYQKKKAFLTQKKQSYRVLIKVCQQALKVMNKYTMHSVEIADTFAEFQPKIAKFEKKLIKCFKSEGKDRFFKLYGHHEFSAVLHASQNLDEEPNNPKLLFIYFKKLFESYELVAHKLIMIIELVMKNLQFESAECKAWNDISKLKTLWLKHHKINRFTAWQEIYGKEVANWSQQQQEDFKDCQKLLAQEEVLEQQQSQRNLDFFAAKS